MHETDKDIEELQRLLGPAVSDYRALEPKGDLAPFAPPNEARFSERSVAIAAAAFLAVSVGMLVIFNHEDPHQNRPGAQISISTSLPGRPGPRPTVGPVHRPAISLSRSSVGSMPRNPVQSGG